MEVIRLQTEGVKHHVTAENAYDVLRRLYDERMLSWLLLNYTVWTDLNDLKGFARERVRNMSDQAEKKRAYNALVSAHLWPALKMHHALQVKLKIITPTRRGETV